MAKCYKPPDLHPLPLYEERALLKAISAGDEKAFRMLYDAYFHRLSAYIFKLCKSETATEEIVQDIFIKLWVHRLHLADIDNPEAYILSMARNKTIDYLRHLAKETGLIGLLTARSRLSDNNIEERLNAESLRRLIEEALAPLSEQKRKIFRLSNHEGLSHDEIADALQLSKSTVKNHLSETLQHIRKYLGHRSKPETLLLLLALSALH